MAEPPPRLFLDANVLFTAAHRPQGKAAFLFQALALSPPAPWQLLSSAYAVAEARRNLLVKQHAALPALEDLLPQLRIVRQPASPRVPLALPAKDLPIWAAAQAAASHLLTGDLKDFGAHMNRPQATAGIVIQTVGEFLAAWPAP